MPFQGSAIDPPVRGASSEYIQQHSIALEGPNAILARTGDLHGKGSVRTHIVAERKDPEEPFG